MDVDNQPAPLANVSASSVEEIQRLCKECLDTVSVDGGGVSLMTSRGHAGTLWSSDSVAARVEELQFTLGEGPCFDATSSGTPVLIADVQDRHEGVGSRWPGFLSELAAMQVRAIFGLPLRVGSIRLGAMDLYRHEPGPLTRPELSSALRTADAATHALLDLGAGGPAQDNEAAGSSYRFRVHQATGMMMLQLSISIQEALAQLRATAYSEQRSIDEIAADVVERRRRFSKEDL